ncbi:MAG: methanogenesis marker 16 metalloprotein [Candidatus Freyrarchaeum guaymaensis]|nr:methanogenesis marker 16 metalloprotein [Candidatus Sigynarchaeota archaeon]
MRQKEIQIINKKIEKGEAVVMTAEELCNLVRGGERLTVDDVDVVTSATKALMSGTLAVFTIPVAERGAFHRAKALWLNGIPAYPGPCPNERLGLVDAILYGTAHSITYPNYGGGHLFREMVERKQIEVEVETTDGKRLTTTSTLDEMLFARMITTRSVCKNYAAFINPRKETVKTIFSVAGMRGPYLEATVCGCGELNPIAKDPNLATIGIGTKLLINGAEGYVLGRGTRSKPDNPNLMIAADMFDMKPAYMGGFKTSQGPEVIVSCAIPIPITSQAVLEATMVTDEKFSLPVMDVHNREIITYSKYSDAWQGNDLVVKYHRNKCVTPTGEKSCNLEICPVESLCPTGAFSLKRGIDRTLCFNCTFCVHTCKQNAFTAKTGKIPINGKEIPITLRQSDRLGARKLAIDLKRRIEKGEFLLSEPVERISFLRSKS